MDSTATVSSQSTGTRLPTRKQVIWLFGFSLVVAGIVWLTLYEVRHVALTNPANPADLARCIANHPGIDTVTLAAACPDHLKVIFAARNPNRNAISTFIILMIGGYLYLIYHYSRRGPSFGRSIPPAKAENSP